MSALVRCCKSGFRAQLNQRGRSCVQHCESPLLTTKVLAWTLPNFTALKHASHFVNSFASCVFLMNFVRKQPFPMWLVNILSCLLLQSTGDLPQKVNTASFCRIQNVQLFCKLEHMVLLLECLNHKAISMQSLYLHIAQLPTYFWTPNSVHQHSHRLQLHQHHSDFSLVTDCHHFPIPHFLAHNVPSSVTTPLSPSATLFSVTSLSDTHKLTAVLYSDTSAYVCTHTTIR